MDTFYLDGYRYMMEQEEKATRVLLKVINGEAPVYFKTWALEMQDGTQGYGVSVSYDGGWSWKVTHTCKTEDEAYDYAFSHYGRSFEQKTPSDMYYQLWNEKEDSNGMTKCNEATITDKKEHAPIISPENKRLIHELAVYCASAEKTTDRSKSIGALLDEFINEGRTCEPKDERVQKKRNEERYIYVGISLRKKRKEKGITQSALAKKAGVSSALISRIENILEPHGFSLEVLFKLADALEIEPTDLLPLNEEIGL